MSAFMNKRADPKQRRLSRLIEKATVDCYDEGEQAAGLLTAIQDHVGCPMSARVVGEQVQVVRFDSGEGGMDIVALCKRRGKTYKISVTSIEWDRKPPKGAEWIEAYRAWLKGT